MIPSHSLFYHLRSKRPADIPTDKAWWPKEWTTVYYKTYPRLPRISLTDNSKIKMGLVHALLNRRSERTFDDSQTLHKKDISAILQYSCGINKLSFENGDISRRVQPSGGARYPLEAYLFFFSKDSDLKPGIYHYNVKEHAFEVLWEREFTHDEIGAFFTYKWARNITAAFILTANFWRSQNKYGERGYRYVMFEAGHIVQNISLVTQALQIKSCAIGGMKDAVVEKMLDIDGSTESVLYAIGVGK